VLVSRCKNAVRKCKECSKLQAKKDAGRWVAEAEAMGQEDKLQDKDITQAQEPKSEPVIGATCARFSHHRKILQLKNQSCNIKSGAMATYVCFCPCSIVNLIPSKCFGVTQNILSA
jgi:hypothetical protein